MVLSYVRHKAMFCSEMQGKLYLIQFSAASAGCSGWTERGGSLAEPRALLSLQSPPALLSLQSPPALLSLQSPPALLSLPFCVIPSLLFHLLQTFQTKVISCSCY